MQSLHQPASSPNAPTAQNDGARGLNPLSVLGQVREIEQLLGSFVATWHGSARVSALRRWHRAAYEKRIALIPLDDRTEEPIGDPILVTGRDISVDGISFTHNRPLSCRKAAVTLREPNKPPVTLVVRLSWCRCTREGLYQSGGHFLRTLGNRSV